MIQVDGPFYRVAEPTFELLIPRWEGHDPETQREADVTIILPNGTRYHATFMTLDTIAAVMRRGENTGENLNGDYFWCSDLVVIRRPGIPAIIEAVRHLIATDDLAGARTLLEPETPDS